MRAIFRFLALLTICHGGSIVRAESPDIFFTLNPNIRAAWSYLRTANADLALVELDEFKSAMEAVPPANDLIPIGENMRQALKLAEAGMLKEAQDKVFEARQSFRSRHTAMGTNHFEDCIWDANRVGDVLWPTINSPPDFEVKATRSDISAKLSDYQNKQSACNDSAPDNIKNDPEFRRLMDGLLPSLDKAIAGAKAGEKDIYHRYMIEIISFDRMLYFRFG